MIVGYEEISEAAQQERERNQAHFAQSWPSQEKWFEAAGMAGVRSMEHLKEGSQIVAEIAVGEVVGMYVFTKIGGRLFARFTGRGKNVLAQGENLLAREARIAEEARLARIAQEGRAAREAQVARRTERVTKEVEAATKSEASLWRKADFNGTRVYQRNDLINPNLTDKIGRSNLQRMQEGLAPLGPDGKPINLHHMLQSSDSPIAEVTQTFHQQNSRVIHINPSTIPSGIDRSAFDVWRSNYWIKRAGDF